MGREARDEYGESIAPEEADDRTMGMTCSSSPANTARPSRSNRPRGPTPSRDATTCPTARTATAVGGWVTGGSSWAGSTTASTTPRSCATNCSRSRYGVWDHLKNHCRHRGPPNWALDWVQFLPGQARKPPLRGRHVLTQNDVATEGTFDDIVAYGGWTMDDHHPAGFWSCVTVATGDDLPRGTLALRHSRIACSTPEHRQPDVRRTRRQLHARGDELHPRDGHLRVMGQASARPPPSPSRRHRCPRDGGPYPQSSSRRCCATTATSRGRHGFGRLTAESHLSANRATPRLYATA